MKILTLLALLMAVVGCSENEAPVLKHEFILPDGFKGVFKVTEDKKTGLPVVPLDGVVKIAVPDNGIVVLKSTQSLQKWHKAVAAYKHGHALLLGVGQLPGAEAVAFFDLWSDADGAVFYLVGTRAEFDKVQKDGPWKAGK